MSATILVVDDEAPFRLNMIDLLTEVGYEAIGAVDLAEARKCISSDMADIVLLDINLPDGKGTDLLRETMLLPKRPEFILVTTEPQWEVAVNAMKNGAVDFLEKPVELARLTGILNRCIDSISMRRELEQYRLNQSSALTDFFVGNSPQMKPVMELAYRGAQSQTQILITGHNGTGKGMLARAIHQLGPRSKNLFVHLNSASIPITMLESELFGHEANSFTDAKKRQLGKLELASNGILFLDEISAMPYEMQSKVLTAIEEKSFWRIGGQAPLKSDVQIIAASNRNLPLMIEGGAFRADLYYRLKVLEIHLPSLVERREDIPGFVARFITLFSRHLGVNVQDVTPPALDALMSYHWPGNVRELKNTIERAMILCDDPAIDLQHLPSEITSSYVA